MRLATLRTPSGTRAVRVDDDALVELDAPDLGAWLARPDWRERTATASGRRRPVETDQFDWEGELVVVVGAEVRRADGEAAAAAIAGFSVANDATCRDWQNRTNEWMQGKNGESSTPVGPWLVTPDELPGGVRPACRITTEVNGVVVQDDTTADLVFDPVALVAYASTIVRLRPGDLILTGTPGGVGHARRPPRYLAVGDVVSVSIEGVGRQVNPVVAG